MVWTEGSREPLAEINVGRLEEEEINLGKHFVFGGNKSSGAGLKHQTSLLADGTGVGIPVGSTELPQEMVNSGHTYGLLES